MKEAEIDPKTLKTLIDAFDASDWEEMTLTLPGGDGLHLSRNPDSTGPGPFGAPPPAPAIAPAAAAPPSSAPPASPPAAIEPGPASPSASPGTPDATGVPVAST